VQVFLIFIGIILLFFIIFVVYFIFKILEFVLVSVKLYKKMANRQEAMVQLLLDIRDNTKSFQKTQLREKDEKDEKEQYPFSHTGLTANRETIYDDESAELEFCYHCGERLDGEADKCPKCGKEL